MDTSNDDTPSKMTTKRFGCLHVLGFIMLAALIAFGVSFFLIKAYIFPSAFKPVALTPGEEKILAEKLEDISEMGDGGHSYRTDLTGKSIQSDRRAPDLSPEPYDEKGLKREIGLTERELNGLLSKNTDLADKLAVDLSDDLISAKLLLPVDEDFPVFGGKILRLRSGVVFSYNNGRPVVMLKGVTVMGVPVPNAWLGGIKNIDLVERFGADNGFWKTFSDGIEDIRVEEGLLKIQLKE